MWKTVKLGEICKFENGDRGKNYPSKKHQLTSGVPFINAGDLTSAGEISIDGMAFISPERFNLLGSGKVKLNDILFCLRGSLGKCALNTEITEGAIASSLVILRPNVDVILPEFLLYFLKSKFMAKLISDTAGGAAQPNLSAKVVSNYHFKLPPIVEQQRIVAKLNAACAEIDNIAKTTEKKLKEARKLYASGITEIYFSDKSVPVVPLSTISKIKGGKRLPKGKKLQIEPTSYPYIRVSDFTNFGTIDEKSVQYITEEIRSEISRYTISSEDVYVSIAGTIGKTGIIPKSLDGANLTENAAKIVLNEECDKNYFYFFTTSSSFERQAIAQTRTTAQPKLALERLGAVELPLHNKQTQQAIAKRARDLRDSVKLVETLLNEKLSEIQALKSAILADELISEAA